MYGPNSVGVNDSIAVLDGVVALLLTGLDSVGLRQSTNVILVSDHGMTTLSSDRVIYVDDLIAESTPQLPVCCGRVRPAVFVV